MIDAQQLIVRAVIVATLLAVALLRQVDIVNDATALVLYPVRGRCHLIADMVARRRPEPVEGRGLDRLTDCEHEVMALVPAGLSNDEIAAHLYLSPLTVKAYVSRAMTKLNPRDRAQLVFLAYETGLVSPGGR